jgi:uncharacterized membrane protein YbhN (UPF0104 family)/tRNA A-37 threonylcarbamoyl transferase component Bud32
MLRLSVGRHPGDVTRMVVAAGLVLACLVAARQSSVNPVEAAIFTQVEELPSWSARGWQGVALLGSWPGIALAGGIALYFSRIRLSSGLVASGVVAWFLTAVMHWVTEPRAMPLAFAHEALRSPGARGFDFPDAHVAVAAALATAGAPYLRRPSRQIMWVLVVLVAVADVFLGKNLPLGAFAGAVLGWGTGTLSHLVLGAPGRRASEESVLAALRDSGLDPVRISTTGRFLLRPQEFELLTADGDRLQMKLVRRLHRLAGPTYKLRRAVASLDTQYDPGLSTPRHEVEHEAYITLLAERAGVGVLPVLLAGEIEHGPPFLIRRHIDGRPLSTLDADELDDDLLARIWEDVTTLGRQHIAHHDLRAANILVDRAGQPRIADFTLSRAGGPRAQSAQDVAEMLVSLTSVVGVDRAVDSAVECLSQETLEEALPHLQWLVLHSRIRNQCGSAKVTLAYLRETLAERIGVPVPSFRSPVRPATVAMMLAGGFAVYLLLPQLASMSQVLSSLAEADWRWLAVVVISGMLAILASAVTVLGSTPQRLPVRKTLAVQVAAAFTGRTTAAGIGFYGVNMVFLERLGLRRTHAVGVILLNRVAMGLVSAVATGLGLLVIGNAVPLGELAIPTGPLALSGVAVVVCVAVAVLVSPFGRRRVWRPLAASTHELGAELLPVLHRPLRSAQLFGGAIAFLALSAYGLAATLSAFGADYPLLPVLAVYIVGSTLGQIAPTPGGLGAVEAALVAGLTAVGVGSTVAVAAVLASRLLSFWLPVLPGLVAFRVLQRRGVV